MDADVLYAPAILKPLLAIPVRNRFLSDRDFIPGDEPVKICVDNGRIVEFRKQLAPDLHYNECGESVGFFSLDSSMAARLAATTEAYIAAARREAPYEEAIRDLALAYPDSFHVEDVTGVPWIEIDFPEDIIRANEQILQQIND
jgi:choline kinase